MALKQWVGLLLAATAITASGCGNAPPPPYQEVSGAHGIDAVDSQSTSAPRQIESSNAARSVPVMAGPSADPAPAPAGGMDEVVAVVNGQKITLRQLVAPLVDSHGLVMLTNLVQLELARQDAARVHVTVTDADIAREFELTLDKLFKDSPTEKSLDAQLDAAVANKKDADAQKLRAEIRLEREELLDQFLENQHIGRGEFDVVVKINAYLRKTTEPAARGRINDDAVGRAFGQLYGERVEVRYMELATMDEVGQAKRRLAAGDSFASVARDMSRNRRSAALGGELPPFSREAGSVPQNFKDVSFNLKDGEVSDVVGIGNTYILIKRIRVLPPQAVKLENVKQNIRDLLSQKLLDAMMKKAREDLAVQALAEMQIKDPVLARQFHDRQDKQIRDRERIKLEMDKQQRLLNGIKGDAATRPATQPSAAPAATAPAGTRPAATQPANPPAQAPTK